MKVIVGLGNPESRYERTRHNAGFMAVDRLVARHAPGERAKGRFHGAVWEARIGGERCAFIKPTTYMNRSGMSVGAAVRYYKADPAQDLLVLVDDVALPIGTLRARGSGGTGGHNGLADIQRMLGTDAYPRLRIGIDSPPPGFAQVDWVLSRFTDEDLAGLGPALEKTADACEQFTREGIVPVMNAFNAKDKPKPAKPKAGASEPDDRNTHEKNDTPAGTSPGAPEGTNE